MGHRGQGPKITCPGCSRQVSIGPNNERIHPHDNPMTKSRCDSSSQQIDLYGTSSNPNGGAQ